MSLNNEMEKIIIVTHNGQFHADEVLACALLLKFYDDYECKIIRSREEEDFEKGTIVVDVGQIYNPKKGRYDHHQKGCHEVYSDKYSIPMSSAGMVYKEYGFTIMYKLVQNKDINYPELTEIMYRNFIAEIDALDNGVPQFPKETEYTASFRISTNLTSTISKMNYIDAYDHNEQMKRFYKAIDYAFTTFKIHVDNMVDKMLSLHSDRHTVSIAMKERKKHHKSKKILVITEDCPNWLHCIREYTNNTFVESDMIDIRFIIYPAENDEWRIRGMPGATRFENKGLLLDKETLDKDIDDMVFVHHKKFIGGTLTLESAIKAASLSLSQYDE